MRRGVRILVAVAIAVVAMAGVAQATPTISLTARPSPVLGFRHTGNIAGAGASLEFIIEISGTEYGGYPPPLTSLSLSFPPGTRWEARRFPKCGYPSVGLLFPGLPCPLGSQANRPSTAQLAVVFGQEVVPETVSVEPFYNPRGGLSFYIVGHSPVLVEPFARGVFTHHGEPPVLRLDSEFTHEETVPGAQLASFTELSFIVGWGLTVAGKPQFSLRMPKACPRGWLPFRVEASFGGPTPQTASARYRAPCPIGAHQAPGRPHPST